jgi:hypothetical protein
MFTLLVSTNAFGDTKNVQEPIKVKSVQVSGMFDVHNESLIMDTLKRSQNSGATLYVIKLDSNAIAGGDIKKTATAQLKNAKCCYSDLGWACKRSLFRGIKSFAQRSRFYWSSR